MEIKINEKRPQFPYDMMFMVEYKEGGSVYATTSLIQISSIGRGVLSLQCKYRSVSCLYEGRDPRHDGVDPLIDGSPPKVLHLYPRVLGDEVGDCFDEVVPIGS